MKRVGELAGFALRMDRASAAALLLLGVSAIRKKAADNLKVASRHVRNDLEARASAQ
jgi:hypothetical protein